mmetsp:Transcript_24012/g.70846  ORF Transcript_24012/g.70846 Transcript_24012/m.70846 type:complete len:123 (-) Transcript_24012:1017-1385(-)
MIMFELFRVFVKKAGEEDSALEFFSCPIIPQKPAVAVGQVGIIEIVSPIFVQNEGHTDMAVENLLVVYRAVSTDADADGSHGRDGTGSCSFMMRTQRSFPDSSSDWNALRKPIVPTLGEPVL